MVDAARPSCRAIARKLSPSPLSAASRSLSSSLRCVPPDIAPSRIAVPGQNLTTRPQDVALHARLRLLTLVYSISEYLCFVAYAEAFPDEAELGALLGGVFGLLQASELVLLLVL